jgi:hypothetical protein
MEALFAHRNPEEDIVPNPSESIIPFTVAERAPGTTLSFLTIGVVLLGVVKVLLI